MNIRRFTAPDMRGALNAIRAELGADAVMLSSRRLDEGVEVIAAIDYDDALFARMGGATGRAAGRAAEATTDAVATDDEDDENDAALSEYERVARAYGRADAAVTAATRAVSAPAAARAIPAVAAPAIGLAATQAAGIAAASAAASPAVEPASVAPIAAPVAVAPAAQPAAVAAPPATAEVTPDTSLVEELKDLRRLLETQLASLAWNDLNRRTPVRARVLRELSKLGVDAELAAELADAIPHTDDSQQAMRAVVRLFGERLPLTPWDMAETGGVFALVGPTGVGKTTTIAKIAARVVLRHGSDAVGLVSTDTYRVGARQQLSNFARILQCPLHVAENAADLNRILDGFARKKLVLIDTAGMSQRDVRLANQFATLNGVGHHIRSVLVLSAGADRGCLTEALSVFKAAAPEALILTKLDEAAALGGVLSLATASELPIAYLSDGQRVPEDLHLAAPKRFWLLHNAVKLTLNPGVLPDERALAEAFGQRELAANA